MNCEAVVLELTGEAPSPEVSAHLTNCAACREAALVVGWACLPLVSTAELAALRELPQRALEQHRRQALVFRGGGRQVLRLALAAGLGAALASAVLLGHPGARLREPVVVEVPLEVPALAQFEELDEFDEPNLLDDEVFFEVSWPEVESSPQNGAEP